MSSSHTDAVWTTVATVGVHLGVCVSHKDLSVTLDDKCHRWCHHTPILETDGPETAWKNGTFLFFFSARVHAHWDLLTNLLKSTHWLGFGRDLSTAVPFIQHIWLSPQPSQRTPAKRVETRGIYLWPAWKTTQSSSGSKSDPLLDGGWTDICPHIPLQQQQIRTDKMGDIRNLRLILWSFSQIGDWIIQYGSVLIWLVVKCVAFVVLSWSRC